MAYTKNANRAPSTPIISKYTVSYLLSVGFLVHLQPTIQETAFVGLDYLFFTQQKGLPLHVAVGCFCGAIRGSG